MPDNVTVTSPQANQNFAQDDTITGRVILDPSHDVANTQIQGVFHYNNGGHDDTPTVISTVNQADFDPNDGSYGYSIPPDPMNLPPTDNKVTLSVTSYQPNAAGLPVAGGPSAVVNPITIIAARMVPPPPRRAALPAGRGAAAGRSGTDGYGAGTVVITAPSPGAAVVVNFSAYGTISGALSNNVTGTISNPSGSIFTGTTVTQGPNWQINFTQPSGSLLNCVLKVACTDQAAVFAQETLGGSTGGGTDPGGGGKHL
jgi:hypothetical protein